MRYKLKDPNYNFNRVNFNSDKPLSNHVKEPFPNKSFTLAIIGRPGSGKTSMLINLLKSKGQNRVYNKVFDKIILVMPKNSRDNIKSKPFKNLPDDQLFDEFTPEVEDTVNRFYNDYTNELEKTKEVPTFNQLLILDDITSELKNKDIEAMLKRLTFNRRHIHLSIIILVQYLRSIPKPIRFNITDIVYFQPSNQLDANLLNEEFLGFSSPIFSELKQIVWNDKHDFMIINKDTNSIFKNLQKIIIDDNSNTNNNGNQENEQKESN